MAGDVVWQTVLRDSLASLAAPADEQVRANGPGCVACDLFEDFENARRVAVESGELSRKQNAILATITAEFSSMQPQDSECCNNYVLRRPAWEALRRLAATALFEFGWAGAAATPYLQVAPGVWHRKLDDGETL